MRKNARRHHTLTLLLLILAALAYGALIATLHTISGVKKLDGILGVLLGLFIASFPAANMLDLLFFARAEMRGSLSLRAYRLWWLLNGLVLLAAWYAVTTGLLQFSSGGIH